MLEDLRNGPRVLAPLTTGRLDLSERQGIPRFLVFHLRGR